MTYEIVNPKALGEPRGWNNGLLAPVGGRVLFVAGQTARDETESVPSEWGFVEQFGQALRNVLMVVREAGGGPEHVGRLTVYVTDLAAYRAALPDLGATYREAMGKHYPAMALVEVSGLVDDHAVVEIEATAVLPGGDPDDFLIGAE
jgi:enamine deaminase RidA (YjgF/YER057c/UK114 family)